MHKKLDFNTTEIRVLIIDSYHDLLRSIIDIEQISLINPPPYPIVGVRAKNPEKIVLAGINILVTNSLLVAIQSMWRTEHAPETRAFLL